MLKRQDMKTLTRILIRYLFYVYTDAEQAERQMHSVPISRSGEEANLAVDLPAKPSKDQMRLYYQNVLNPILNGKTFDRLVLVDYSWEGESVDGFKTLLEFFSTTSTLHSSKNAIDNPVFINMNTPDDVQKEPGTMSTVAVVGDEAHFDAMDDLADGRITRVVAAFDRRQWGKSIQEVNAGIEPGRTQVISAIRRRSA